MTTLSTFYTFFLSKQHLGLAESRCKPNPELCTLCKHSEDMLNPGENQARGVCLGRTPPPREKTFKEGGDAVGGTSPTASERFVLGSSGLWPQPQIRARQMRIAGANRQLSRLEMKRMKHFICEILKLLYGIFVVAILYFVL